MKQLCDVDFIINKLRKNEEDIKKVAYTGSHGTGKTTSSFNLASQCKLHCSTKSIHIITEVASESPYKINKETTEESQTWIYASQMKAELDASARYKLLILDRTIVDSIAYSKRAGFNDLVERKIEMSKSFIHTYDYIFFKQICDNNFLFEDGIRDGNDMEFRQKIEDYLLEYYDKLIPYMKSKEVFKLI